LLVLGVSGCIFLPVVKLFSNKRIIVNLDGLEWRRAKWSGWIKKFLIFSERMAVRYADETITDNAALQTYVLEHYGTESTLIEYGADHVSPVSLSLPAVEQYSFLKNTYAFKVCRIEPENNIHIVLDAFKKLNRLPLVIVGNWSHSTYGRELRAEYEHIPNIYLLDPIYEPSKLNLLRSNCGVYIHGHSAGGTNPSLVEAMYLGLPILAYDAIYNKVTTEYKGAYFHTAEDLHISLLTYTDQQLHQLGKTMKTIADRRYTWSTIADKYVATFLEETLQETPTIYAETSSIVA